MQNDINFIKQSVLETRINAINDKIFWNWPQMSSNEQAQMYRDLRRMNDNVHDMYSRLDQMTVECRRLGRITAQYCEKLQAVTAAVDTLEQFMVTAILML